LAALTVAAAVLLDKSEGKGGGSKDTAANFVFLALTPSVIGIDLLMPSGYASNLAAPPGLPLQMSYYS